MLSNAPQVASRRYTAIIAKLLGGLLLTVVASIGVTTIFVLLIYYSVPTVIIICAEIILLAVWIAILLKVSFHVTKITADAAQGLLAGSIASVSAIVISPPLVFFLSYKYAQVVVYSHRSPGSPGGDEFMVLAMIFLPAFILAGTLFGAIGSWIGGLIGQTSAESQAIPSHDKSSQAGTMAVRLWVVGFVCALILSWVALFVIPSV